ncbi:hypothetical protein JCM21900_006609, partial [Sporobolomyces salmonicolor]
PVKLIVSIIWAALVFPRLRRVVYRPLPNFFSMLVNKAETLYLHGFVLLHLYVTFLHPLLFPCTATTFSAPSVVGHCDSSTGGNCTLSDPVSVPIHSDAAAVEEPSMEFLPLMLTSVYCAVGIVWSWLRLSCGYLLS